MTQRPAVTRSKAEASAEPAGDLCIVQVQWAGQTHDLAKIDLGAADDAQGALDRLSATLADLAREMPVQWRRRDDDIGRPIATYHYAQSPTRPRRFRLLQDLVPAGQQLDLSGLTSATYHAPVCELVIGIGRDHAATLVVPLDACETHPGLFEEIDS